MVNPTFFGSSFAEYPQQMKIQSNPQTHAVSLLMILSHFSQKRKGEKRDADSFVCEVLMWNVIGSGVHLLR